MRHYPSTLPKSIIVWLEQWLTTQGITQPDAVEPLAGDGSARQFFRVHYARKTCILLSDPDWIFSKDYASHQAYLAAHNIPVPQFFSVDASVGALVMEDLGDELLQYHLQKEPASKMVWLGHATRLLAKLHGSCYPVPHDLPAATRSFDEAKYFQELCFTQEHLSEKFLSGVPLSSSQKDAIFAFCRKIATTGPTVFSHRDYHTRNLLKVGKSLSLIDFQDARLGPVHYDLASLLYDAYVPVSDEERTTLVAIYQKELSQYPKLYEQVNWAQFFETMGEIAYQRVVKAAGSFASFFTKHGKKTHLPYLIPALESALALERRFGGIKDLVGDSIPVENWLKQLRSQNLTP